jgi:homoaconitase/3-isopropylmalate dehydratase large subunit
VEKQARAEGIHKVFEEAGFVLRQPDVLPVWG